MKKLNCTRRWPSKKGELDVTTFNFVIHYINYLAVLNYFIFDSITNIGLEIMFLQVLPIFVIYFAR